MTQNTIDFGFTSDQFNAEPTSVPYAQFLNASSTKFGLAITSTNAELAGFQLIDTWKAIEHEFADGSDEILLLSDNPRLLVLNRSRPMMSNGIETVAYDKTKFNQGGYKAFSYCVVWFLDDKNQPISELPFRLKCSGFAGFTFLQNYSYYNRTNSFCEQFLRVYQNFSGDRAGAKNSLFYAHAVYQPHLTRQQVTSSHNAQSSFAVVTNGFTEPTCDNFANLIIPNGSLTSKRIKELTETTLPWLPNPSTERNIESTVSLKNLDGKRGLIQF